MIGEKSEIRKEVKVEMSSEGDITMAEVTIETTKDGETTTETKTFTGTEEEVKAQIDAMKEVEVNIEKVPSAVPDRYPGYPDHNRLESVYSTLDQKTLNLITILFPHNETHAKAPMSRISSDNYSGCSIDHGSGILDIILESSGDVIAWMDADMSMPPKVLYQLVKSLENSDIAIASRYVEFGKDDRGRAFSVAARFYGTQGILEMGREMI